MPITVRQLEVVRCVARVGSFRRAAEELGISQVVVTEHIRAIEAELGVPLFVREAGRPARPTRAAIAVVRRAQALLDGLDGIRDELAPTASPAATLRVAADPFLAGRLHDVVDRSAARAGLLPAIDVRRRAAPELRALVARGDLDVAVYLAFGGPAPAGSTVVGHEPMAVLVGRGHPWVGAGPVSPVQLEAAPRVEPPADDPLQALIRAVLGAAGVRRHRIGLATTDFGLVLATLGDRASWVCVPRGIHAQFGGDGSLVEVDLALEVPALDVRVLVAAPAERAAGLGRIAREISRALDDR